MKTINDSGPTSHSILRNLRRRSRAARPQNWREFSGKFRGLLVMLFLFELLIGGCGSTGTAKSEDPANAPTAAVVRAVRKDISNDLQIASELQPFQEVNVYAKGSGYIQK